MVLAPLTLQISVGIDGGCALTIRGHSALSAMTTSAHQAQILCFTRTPAALRKTAASEPCRRLSVRTCTFSAIVNSPHARLQCRLFDAD